MACWCIQTYIIHACQRRLEEANLLLDKIDFKEIFYLSASDNLTGILTAADGIQTSRRSAKLLSTVVQIKKMNGRV